MQLSNLVETIHHLWLLADNEDEEVAHAAEEILSDLQEKIVGIAEKECAEDIFHFYFEDGEVVLSSVSMSWPKMDMPGYDDGYDDDIIVDTFFSELRPIMLGYENVTA